MARTCYFKLIHIQFEQFPIRRKPNVEKPVRHLIRVRSFDERCSNVRIVTEDLLILVQELQQVEMLMKEIDFRNRGGALILRNETVVKQTLGKILRDIVWKDLERFEKHIILQNKVLRKLLDTFSRSDIFDSDFFRIHHAAWIPACPV